MSNDVTLTCSRATYRVAPPHRNGIRELLSITTDDAGVRHILHFNAEGARAFVETPSAALQNDSLLENTHQDLFSSVLSGLNGHYCIADTRGHITCCENDKALMSFLEAAVAKHDLRA